MNREGVRKNWAIIVAFEQGKDIQFYNRTSCKWEDTDAPSFLNGTRYRIKPEPDVYWVNVYKKEDGTPSFGIPYKNKTEADELIGYKKIDCIKIVMPE